ncbi:putative membrane protein [Rhodovulum bhavnagarense]|uniref:Putative membrane protein n=1 Tax=Rhodovulum bhavnagarense TaxID=992286 RepID=A0A4R2RE71_9RHOB|nr:periplasmic heavy metal sensor [Rhodovulum bhavnagarense]TCP60834.1 putative membrane protein [Rhodovulum bhavnagarense]
MAEGRTRNETAPPTRTWVRVMLIASLALNLLILGMVGGAVVGHRGASTRADLGEAAYGPYARALADEDRAALRAAMRSQAPRLRENRKAVRQGFNDLLDALRAEPYMPEHVAVILATQEAHARDQGEIWRDLMTERLAAMTPEQRAAFADRLERVLRRGPSHPRRDGSAPR